MKLALKSWVMPKPLSIAIITLSMSAYYFYKELDNTPVKTPVAPLVDVVKIHKKTQAPIVSIYGQTKTVKPHVATTKYAGVVEAIMVKPGDNVESGQAVVKLKSEPEGWQVLVAVQHELQNEIAKTKELLATLAEKAQTTKATSDINQYNVTKNHLAKTESALALHNQEIAAQASANTIILRAEHNGTIESILANPGQKVSSIDPIFEQKPTDNLFVEATLPDSIIPIIRRALANQVGLHAIVYNTKASYTAQLVNTYQANDGRTTLAKARLRIPTKTNLAAGIGEDLLLIRLALPHIPNSYAVPEAAIHNNNRVYSVSSDNRLRVHKVKMVGKTINDNGQTELLIRAKDDLHEHDIIVSSQANLLTGMKVIKSTNI